MNYVLHACALIAYVRGEAGNLVVEDILLDSRSNIVMHAVNACEVYYDFVRSDGRNVASSIIEDSTEAGMSIVEELAFDFWKSVGDIKAEFRVSLADAFAITLAQKTDATLVTSDHHEFDSLVDKGLCRFLFIR